MKLKIFALFVALLFIGTATLTAAYPSTYSGNEIKPIPKRPKRFSGEWGFISCGKEPIGRTKGIIMFKRPCPGCPPQLLIKGVLCIDGECNDPEGCLFTLWLFKERNPCNPHPCPRKDLMSGIVRGYMCCQWECIEPSECDCDNGDCCDCECYDHDYVICCMHARGPFTGDWFIYHGWLMIMGTYYGQKIWFKAYIGSWFYPGIECYIPDK